MIIQLYAGGVYLGHGLAQKATNHNKNDIFSRIDLQLYLIDR